QGPKYRVLRREKATHERPPILPVARMVKRRVPVGPWISISVVLPSAVPVLSKVILPRTSVVLILTSGLFALKFSLKAISPVATLTCLYELWSNSTRIVRFSLIGIH